MAPFHGLPLWPLSMTRVQAGDRLHVLLAQIEIEDVLSECALACLDHSRNADSFFIFTIMYFIFILVVLLL